MQLTTCSQERDTLSQQLSDEKLAKVKENVPSLFMTIVTCKFLRTKSKLNDRLEDCLAFLERAKKLQNGPESATNMEYLKNCVLHYMLSSAVSERLRLYPVIGTILKFTSSEMTKLQECPLHIDEIAASIELASSSWSSITGLASTSFQGIFGTYSTANNSGRDGTRSSADSGSS